jgi:hypothetical protein
VGARVWGYNAWRRCYIHEVAFEVVNRQTSSRGGRQVVPIGAGPPESWETGKDSVIAYPGQVTRLRLRFNTPGQFVWHCHIVEHEDNEMMRPIARPGSRAALSKRDSARGFGSRASLGAVDDPSPSSSGSRLSLADK